jgi:hypothetical protein
MSELEELEALEIDFVGAYSKAVDCDAKLAASLIGATLEEIGTRIEQRHGAILAPLGRRYPYDN